MDLHSLLTGANASWLDQQYAAWLDDPHSVRPQLAALFDEQGREPGARGPSVIPRSIFDPAGGGPGVSQEALIQATERQSRVAQLINAYRVRGHLNADIDPLGRRERFVHPELSLQHYGLTRDDLHRVVPTMPLYGMPRYAPLGEVIARLEAAYCGAIGAEFMNINDLTQRQWVQRALEISAGARIIRDLEAKRALRKMSDAEAFEQLIHTRFPGTKRFSLEGAETLVPLLDLLIDNAAARGVLSVIIGMAHRGRLNVLANVLGKPVSTILDEFTGAETTYRDVKYHLGYSADIRTSRGAKVHLTLAFNPSHLEAVDPVVEGRARAKQDRAVDTDRNMVMPVLIHGDAAFAGQGLVAEVLNLSELAGYRTGGTVHLIVNNQIGFTTAPREARSGPYATDIARMLGVPIFHVNGEDPHAVTTVTTLAAEYRRTFGRDVVIDMYCYRKYGHNEGDEPSFTQPMMYEQIRSRATPRAVYARNLVARGVLSQAEADRILGEARDELERASQHTAQEPVDVEVSEPPSLDLRRADVLSIPLDSVALACPSPLRGLWDSYQGSLHDPVDTTIAPEVLGELLMVANTIPEGFTAHRKIERLVSQRQQMIAGERPMDWAMGEQAAFATLVDRGIRVRLSGQDSGRGTFSHRHAVYTDILTGAEHVPLAHLDPQQAPFQVFDSALSEASVLGFEFGYSLAFPDALVVWEAQFGDFANGAQVIIDQFICSTEAKWSRFSGVVMLLPHGYEGQGPEHSSARLERFLQLCAEENMIVANCTTPASFSHLLRHQALSRVRKPLVVMTPKSLLRHPVATSTLEELASGRFRAVIPELEDLHAEEVGRVVLCSGKVYYDLLARRQELNQHRVALVRVEQLYPWPAADLDAVLAAYPDSAEVVWCQEEPANMGAWPVALHWMLDHRPGGRMPRFVGRPAAASPATGSHKQHVLEQAALVNDALSL